jgi:hypothetical protein
LAKVTTAQELSRPLYPPVGKLLVCLLTVMLSVSSVSAQVPESIVPLPTQQPPARQLPKPDTIVKAPLSPRKAFLTSLLLPGYAQSRLNRPTASMLYAAFEVLAIGMARKSAQDLGEAKRFASDSVVTSYSVDPNTGQPAPASYAPSRYTTERIEARRTHYEDWIAAIFFNHLISAADAYVAAQLWDFNANVSVNNGQRTATISAHRSF